MRRYSLACSVLVAWSAAALADPPKVPPPVTIPLNRDHVVTVAVEDAAKVGVTPGFSDADCLWFRGYSANPKEMIFLVRPYRAGELRVVFWTQGEIVSSTLIINPGGVPPVPPDPKPPDPKPPDPVPPQPVTSFYVLLIRETGANLTPAQNGVFYGKEVEEYLTTHCTRDGSYVGWRRRDKDAPTTGDTPTMNALWGTVKAALGGTYTGPAVALAVNGKVTIEPLPDTAAAMKALVDKYRGGK